MTDSDATDLYAVPLPPLVVSVQGPSFLVARVQAVLAEAFRDLALDKVTRTWTVGGAEGVTGLTWMAGQQVSEGTLLGGDPHIYQRLYMPTDDLVDVGAQLLRSRAIKSYQDRKVVRERLRAAGQRVMFPTAPIDGSDKPPQAEKKKGTAKAARKSSKTKAEKLYGTPVEKDHHDD